MPREHLCEVLAMERLNVGNEKHVLEAVVRWLSHDPEDRRVGNTHFMYSMEMRWDVQLYDIHVREQFGNASTNYINAQLLFMN